MCPTDVTVQTAPGGLSAIALWTPPSSTDNSGSVTVQQTAGPTPGADFPIGLTGIVYVARDEAGNDMSCAFAVIVIGKKIDSTCSL